ncbi:TetR/AcrR family transcriptional regulator [Sphingomonas sp. LaA6.9]|uniref:TetR/AcrR family transcriptional regulator n=1 Tax=Sphingomonas sp. LaA6.9 TaxID=2919914 RepID=UPI001F4F6AB2|nr:TetR/AcrR family transcriptional regulator [Sphingomonas sp. LaA6.9]MCJ8156591.1 TetR/AcrR family transcriptional regulator [Sphingomonas sp. LaA6.9]
MAESKMTQAKTSARSGKTGRTWRRTPPPEHTPSTQEWVDIARRTLVEEGIVGVKIDRIAKIAGVTRGGFYWRFKSHAELLDKLLEDWRASNTQPMLDVLASPGSLNERLSRLADLYIFEQGFSPAYDRAIRAWANLSHDVEGVVQEVDAIRINAIQRAFLDDGYDAHDAMIRARIIYFHQVGYYATGLKESDEQRQALTSSYLRVFTGRD